MDVNIVNCNAAHYYGFYIGSPAFNLFVRDSLPPFPDATLADLNLLLKFFC